MPFGQAAESGAKSKKARIAPGRFLTIGRVTNLPSPAGGRRGHVSRPLAQARGVRRFRRSTGPAHALRAPRLTVRPTHWMGKFV